MEKINMGHSESVMIFCRMIVRFENFKENFPKEYDGEKKVAELLKELHNSDKLIGKLKQYGTDTDELADHFVEVTKDVQWKTRSAKTQKQDTTTYRGSLHDFISDIMVAKSIVVSEKFYKKLYHYIDLKQRPIRKTVQPWIPDSGIETFTDTKWFIYHYDERLVDNKWEAGIVKGLLTFKLFGKVEVKTLAPAKDIDEVYVGRFSILKSSFLLLEMKTENDGSKDLQILFHVGSTKQMPSLAIGHYSNFYTKIYGGRVLIQHARNNSFSGIREAKFFPIKSAGKTRPKIDQNIWAFFKDKDKSFHALPLNVNSTKTLKDAILEEKRRGNR